MPLFKRSKTHVVTFLSEGPPHDNGLPLGDNRPIIEQATEGHVDHLAIYTPRILKQMGHNDLVQEYAESGLVSNNPGMSKIGFCAWRPQIILEELAKLADDDILIYRDGNIKRYPKLGKFRFIRYLARHRLKQCGFDVFVARESEQKTLKEHCKTNILRELGENHPFSFHFPILIANLIILRKSEKSTALMQQWLAAVKHTPWINGQQYGELDPSFKWSCPEQSILNTIIANWVRAGKYDIPLDYPRRIQIRRKLGITLKAKNFDYLKYLDL